MRRRVVVCAPRLPSAASRSGVSPALFLGRLQLAFAIELKLRVVALELLLRVAMVADLRCWGHGDNAGGMGGWDDLQPPSALRCTEFGKDCLVLEWAAPRSTEPLAGYILHSACVHRHPCPVACSVRQKHARRAWIYG